MADKKIIGITMGDPASIGPEITIKALADPALYDRCRPLVVGDAAVMKAARPIVGREDIQIHAVHHVSECLFTPGIIDVYDMGITDPGQLERGKVSAIAGDAAFQ